MPVNFRMLDDSYLKGAPLKGTSWPRLLADPLTSFVIVRKRHTTDVLIVMLTSKYDFSHRTVAAIQRVMDNAISLWNIHGYLYVCATRV